MTSAFTRESLDPASAERETKTASRATTPGFSSDDLPAAVQSVVARPQIAPDRVDLRVRTRTPAARIRRPDAAAGRRAPRTPTSQTAYCCEQTCRTSTLAAHLAAGACDEPNVRGSTVVAARDRATRPRAIATHFDGHARQGPDRRARSRRGRPTWRAEPVDRVQASLLATSRSTRTELSIRSERFGLRVVRCCRAAPKARIDERREHDERRDREGDVASINLRRSVGARPRSPRPGRSRPRSVFAATRARAATAPLRARSDTMRAARATVRSAAPGRTGSDTCCRRGSGASATGRAQEQRTLARLQAHQVAGSPSAVRDAAESHAGAERPQVAAGEIARGSTKTGGDKRRVLE